ncbi:terpenoid cyclases/protein prenyltransferase alpha-alpha toroid [Phakopsora pachyrhizi]|nr:terpenoid cyclases/protein prenyltransferase alpha-alpha toroid [Phakopsora pachyrhizi]
MQQNIFQKFKSLLEYKHITVQSNLNLLIVGIGDDPNNKAEGPSAKLSGHYSRLRRGTVSLDVWHSKISLLEPILISSFFCPSHIAGKSNVFGTALNYVACRLLNFNAEHNLVAWAQATLHSLATMKGGVTGIWTWGKVWLSLLNVYNSIDWASQSNSVLSEEIYCPHHPVADALFWMLGKWEKVYPQKMRNLGLILRQTYPGCNMLWEFTAQLYTRTI